MGLKPCDHQVDFAIIVTILFDETWLGFLINVLLAMKYSLGRIMEFEENYLREQQK